MKRVSKNIEVVILPTDKKANGFDIMLLKKLRTYINTKEGQLAINKFPNSPLYYGNIWETQHLYFLSDDEIKQNDFCYDKVLNLVFQTDKFTDLKYANKNHLIKKVIATTDKLLCFNSGRVGYNIPSPNKKFIEHYVEQYNKGNVIDFVKVEYEIAHISESYFDGEQEKLPLILKVNINDNTINILSRKDSWSREELQKLFESYGDNLPAKIIWEDMQNI
jgi:hypothetical protein